MTVTSEEFKSHLHVLRHVWLLLDQLFPTGELGPGDLERCREAVAGFVAGLPAGHPLVEVFVLGPRVLGGQWPLSVEVVEECKGLVKDLPEDFFDQPPFKHSVCETPTGWDDDPLEG